MKKIISIALIIIVLGGLYFYINGNKLETKQVALQEKVDDAAARRKAEELQNPPSGYLIPGNIPQGYKLRDNGGRFTSYSTSLSFVSERVEQNFGKITNYLNISETSKDTAENWIKREVESPRQVLRVIKDFNYNQNKGVVIGVFLNENVYKKSPLSATEKYLVYDHDGRLFMIHTTDKDISADALIELLKDTTISQ